MFYHYQLLFHKPFPRKMVHTIAMHAIFEFRYRCLNFWNDRFSFSIVSVGCSGHLVMGWYVSSKLVCDFKILNFNDSYEYIYLRSTCLLLGVSWLDYSSCNVWSKLKSMHEILIFKWNKVIKLFSIATWNRLIITDHARLRVADRKVVKSSENS